MNKEDLHKLGKILILVEDKKEIQSALVTMRKILDNESMTLEPISIEDRRDLYNLGKILGSTNDEEEIQPALTAMKKILDNEPMVLESMDLEPIEYNPDIIISPVETILEFTSLDVDELVSIDCWPGITKEMAYMLATITSYSAEFWLNLEKNYQKALETKNQ